MKLKSNNISQDALLERIQDYLYSFYAKDIKYARINEIYDCLCRSLMEEIGKKWVACKAKNDDYEVYVLSFEYLPGKFITDYIYKLGIEEVVGSLMSKIGFSLKDLVDFEKQANIGVGNIGIGSSYIIGELANKKIRSVAYALRYENGNLKQKIVDGKQVEYSEYWLANGYNWEHKKGFSYDLEIDGRNIKSSAYDIPILSDDAQFVATLRLFEAEPSKSVDYEDFTRGDFFKAYDDYIAASSINQFLYLDDSSYEGKLIRLKQEYFYTSSAVRDIFKRYNNKYDSIDGIEDRIKIIVNDVHPTLALVEFVRILLDDYGYSVRDAIKVCRKVFEHIAFSITDDTIETYPVDMLKRVNEDVLSTILSIQEELKLEEEKFEIISYGTIYLKNINLALSDQYYYLSKVLKDEKTSTRPLAFTSLGTDRTKYVDSNNYELMEVLKEFGIGSSKKEELIKIDGLREDRYFRERLEEAKFVNKKDLIYLTKEEKINPYSLFDVGLSIIHESKRQILKGLAIAYKFFTFRENSNLTYTPTTYIFSGKANEGYFMAKETIKFILALKYLIDRDKIIREKIKIVFVEDLDVEKAKIIIKASDIYNNLTLASLDNEDFHLLNSCLNMSNIISTRGGITYNIDQKNSIYKLGQSIDEIKNDKFYRANDFYYGSPMVKYTIENLIKEPYANFPYDFKVMYDQIMMYNDSFRIFKDLEDLGNLMDQVARDYLDEEKWVKGEIDNILWANNFILDDKIVRKR